MQVVILCGGQGTRIRDVAEDIPKPMIPIGGRPILWHIMKGFARQGFTDFILCLGYKSWVIKRFFLDYHLLEADFSFDLGDPREIALHCGPLHDNWHVTMAETGLDAMTGARVKRIEKYITGDRFFLTYGDGVSDTAGTVDWQPSPRYVRPDASARLN
jgi:glucose-1-phosphate cytidylyltransferase